MLSHVNTQELDFQSCAFDSVENMTCDAQLAQSAAQRLPSMNASALNCLQLPLHNIFDEAYPQLSSIPASMPMSGISFDACEPAQSGTAIQSLVSQSHPALLSIPSEIPTPSLILHQPQPRRPIPDVLKAAMGEGLDQFIPRPPSTSGTRVLRSASSGHTFDAEKTHSDGKCDDGVVSNEVEFDESACLMVPLQQEAIVGPALGLGSDRFNSHPISLLLQPLSRPVPGSEDASWDPVPSTFVDSCPGHFRHKDSMRPPSQSRAGSFARMHPYRRDRAVSSHMKYQ